MKEETKKSEGPGCACGKVDLYEEFLKNEENKKKATDTNPSGVNEESSATSDSATDED